MPNAKNDISNGISPERLAKFCREHHIRRLALIGRAPGRRKGSFKEDLLVEFERGQPIGYIELIGTEFKLSRLLRHKVELYTPGSFRGDERKKIVKEARNLFMAE
jgi:predicted nucleotidyltransferase